LIGVPQNLNILHISQLDEFDESRMVLQEILEADKKASATIREFEGSIQWIY
jgi:hypothetical protein